VLVVGQETTTRLLEPLTLNQVRNLQLPWLLQQVLNLTMTYRSRRGAA
jgi:hypothetical protein